jgi:hypothetical protein
MCSSVFRVQSYGSYSSNQAENGHDDALLPLFLTQIKKISVFLFIFATRMK